jgi:hypothetical protein
MHELVDLNTNKFSVKAAGNKEVDSDQYEGEEI